MKPSRLLALCLLPLGVCGVANAQQTLQFSNTTPPITVTLTPNSTLGISATGNVTASCVLATGTGGNARCDGMPAGGPSGNAPTVSLSASFSTTPDGGGLYSPNTNATITISTTQSPEACVLLLDTGSAPNASWAGAITPPYTQRTVALSTASSTYRFKMRCFNGFGAGDSNVIVAGTNAGGGGGCTPPDCPPPGDECTAAQQALADASHPGYTRQTSLQKIPDMRTFAGQACGDFPVSGSPVCLMLAQRNQYIAMKFTAPTDLSQYGLNFIEWQQAQVGGEANTQRTYVTISKCPGDFTRPGDPAITSTDPTFKDGCRNIRNIFGSVSSSLSMMWNLTGVSTSSSCGIVPGQTYYLNYILADPRNTTSPSPPGITPGEHFCSNSDATQCGLQVRLQ